MESSSQDRNLPASERKLAQARDDGQVARSRDLSHLAVLGAGGVAMLLLAPALMDRLQAELARQLTFNAATLAHNQLLLERMQAVVLVGLLACVAFAAFTLPAAIAGALATGGWVFSFKPVAPNFDHINPISGFGRLFSSEQFTYVLKLIVITTILVVVAVQYLNRNLYPLASLMLQPSAASIRYLSQWVVTGVSLLLLVVLASALLDVPLQMYLFAKRMKMSLEEVKQENKNSEGSPEMKGRMRQRQREISQRNSVQAVPKADFVVMNPTHFAVALKYEEGQMEAPHVIAKGADLLAMKIREVAKLHAIPVLQAPALARALYTHAELDQEIPAKLYSAVAQVLAYVYRLKAALRGDGPMPGDLPELPVPTELDPQHKTAGTP